MVLTVLVVAALCGCSRSTSCYNISNEEATDIASRELVAMLQRMSSNSGMPTINAGELEIFAVERVIGKEGRGTFNVKIEYRKSGTPGRLLAFVYEDCAVEWSPQFETRAP